MSRLRTALASAIVAASAVSAQTGVITLPPIADATVDSSQPGINFGSSPELNFGKASGASGAYFMRGHVWFDLVPYMTVTPPDRARVRWYQSRSTAAGCLDVTLHRITTPWIEASVSWSTRPTHDAAVAGRACVGDSFALGWKSFEVTALVRDWVTATHPNFGMVIRDPNESTAGASRPGFGHSRESTQTTLRPYLELSWGTLPFGAGCGTSARLPVLDLSDGVPLIGTSYTLAATDLARSASALQFLGTSKTSWSGVPLPLNLAGLGFPSCNLLVSGQIILTGTTSSSGGVSFRLDLPNDNALKGVDVHHQVVALVVTPALGLSLTNGFTARIF